MVARTSGPFDRIQFTVTDLQVILFGEPSSRGNNQRSEIRRIMKQMGFQERQGTLRGGEPAPVRSADGSAGRRLLPKAGEGGSRREGRDDTRFDLAGWGALDVTSGRGRWCAVRATTQIEPPLDSPLSAVSCRYMSRLPMSPAMTWRMMSRESRERSLCLPANSWTYRLRCFPSLRRPRARRGRRYAAR